MKILVGCEFSGAVRQAFRDRGHAAWSCDLLPAEDGSEFHFQDDLAVAVRWGGWDMLIAFPPCTHLCVSGARWFKEKAQQQAEALAFVRLLMDAPIPRIAIENPIGILSSQIRPPDHPTVAIRTRGNQGDVLMAEGATQVGAHEHRGRPGGADSQDAPESGSRERAIENLRRHCRRHGSSMGQPG